MTGFFIINLIYGQELTETLKKALIQLEEISTASYYYSMTFSAPEDTLAFSTRRSYVNMYVDTTNKYIGAKYSESDIDNHDEYDMCYDGTYKIRFDWTNRNVKIDTMTDKIYGRPMSPFFIRAKELIKYALNHLDSSEVKLNEFQDSTSITFYFRNKIIEFPWVGPFITKSEGKNSRYELVLNKNFLPYKLRRKMPHQTSWEICTDIQISNHLDLDFNFSAIQQIPTDFEIKGRERKEGVERVEYELEGTIAPDWKLKEVYGDSVSLNEIKQKVILMQFTGIGCGYCHASIPFLKKLADDYRDKDFELISVETWSDNVAGIERYKVKNEMNYRFLVSKKEIKDKYKIQTVPSFFVIDDQRVIKKVIVGYIKGETEKEIIKTIDDML